MTTAELDSSDGKIVLTSEFRWKEMIKQIPGSKWDKTRDKWVIPVSWSACLALRSTFRDTLTIGPSLAAWAANERAIRVDPCNDLRDRLDWEGDPTLFGWQRSGVQFIAHGKQVLIGDEMGCIAGDTELIINRAGSASRMTMREFHRKFQGGTDSDQWGHARYKWQSGVSTRIKSMADDGTLGLNEVVDTFSRGNQRTIEITTKEGRQIRCTRDHKISTGYDSWSEAGDLKVGDSITINGKATCLRCESTDDVIQNSTAKFRGYCRKCVYRYMRKDRWNDTPESRGTVQNRGYILLNKQWDHPNANKCGKISEHTVVASETLGRPISATEHVHHVDHNPSNNDPSNLVVLEGVEHLRLHGKAGGFMHLHGGSGKRGEIWFRGHADEIVSIFEAGITDVYDIEMTAPNHNFVANGIVVHNSGKSATAIRGLAELSKKGENVFPILVVCPNSVKTGWKREFEQWWPGIEVSVIKGSAAAKTKAFKTSAHVYVINYESLRSHSRLASFGSTNLLKCEAHGGEDPKVTDRRCQVHPKELNAFKFGSVIVDECHRLKNPQSQQTRALWAAAGDAEFRIAMSGTPIANNVVDLWPILHFLAPLEWPTKTRWVDRFVETMLNAWGSMEVLGIKAHMYDEFYAALNPRFRRMPEELILSHLPPLVFEQRDCEMSAKQAKAYKQMLEEMVSDLESGLLTAANPLTQTTRLLQLASSYANVDAWEEIDEHGFPKVKYRVTLDDPSCKLDAFMDTIEDFGDQQVAVMAVSRQLIELLSRRLEKAKIPHGMITGAISEDDRQRHMDDFQAGKTQFILFTSGAGGTGITLTAARYLARLQIPYSLVDYKQSLKRVKRIGSERHENIIVIDYVTEGTVDTRVFEALVKKEQSFEEVVRDQEALLKLLKETSGK